MARDIFIGFGVSMTSPDPRCLVAGIAKIDIANTSVLISLMFSYRHGFQYRKQNVQWDSIFLCSQTRRRFKSETRKDFYGADVILSDEKSSLRITENFKDEACQKATCFLRANRSIMENSGISVKSRFMNARASGSTAYIPTDLEHIANVLTHALSVVPSFLGLSSLLRRSRDLRQLFSGFVYGAALVALFLISTVFHIVFYSRRCRSLKETLHMCDRAVIYIFIAASYTPWLTLKDAERNFWTQNLGWIVWTMAVLGIVYQYYFHERFKTLETFFYLVIGVTPGYAMFYMHESSGLLELCAGGIVYMLGVIFFKSDGRIPCAHAIWHLFVNLGATLHFYAVHKYLINNNQQQQHTES